MKKRPTGTTTSIAALLVLIASYAGLEVTAEQAAVIIGGVAALVATFTPRA
jgi:hypothetical protein